jgi:zinc D-Ala-D-Ala carboxypeptidase
LNGIKINNMISKHISDKEGVYSITATRLGLDNKPSQFELANMKELAEQIFEPLREWVSGPIRINSFYRGKALNKAIGGSTASQHCKGQAMDIDDGGCKKDEC